MRPFYYFAAAVLAAYFLWLWLVPEPAREYVPLTAGEKQIVIERHRYHGIEASVCEGGECWFVRKGRRVRL